MKNILLIMLLCGSAYAVDPYDGKEYKMRQSLQNLNVTGTGNNALDLSGGAMIDGQVTITSTLTVQGNMFSVGTSTLMVSQGGTGIGNTMFINYPLAPGKIGIGTTAPATKLHMSSGTLTIDGNVDTLAKFRGNSRADVYIQDATSGFADTDGADIALVSNALYVWNKEDGPVIFYTNNSEKSRITPAGGYVNYARTKAQINAIDPYAAGEQYYCSDCTAVTMCVSTGTAVGSFVKVSDKSAVCD